ncbi:MAG: serine hydrolase [Chloroflexi bacterium]|nr:serine hydrolase [Chloroflexota bacterium]
MSTAPRLVFWAASPAPVAQAAPGAPVLALRAPAIYAGSAYLLDMDTGQVLFQKFPTARRPMASAAKIMTGLLAAESGRLDEVATVSRRAAAIGETTMGLVEGEQVPVGELLFGLLMNSGNDAAVVLAEHLAGSVDAFATWMNERAAALGLAGTQYANPHGLDHGIFASPQQYSTARDLAVLASTAMGSPVFARAAGSRLREVAAPPDKEPHRLRHTIGALWWYPGATGVKTGWTGRAGQVRVVTAERGGTRLVAVVMGSPDHVAETRALLDYGFASSAKADVQKLVPLGPEALPTPAPGEAQAWETYKQLALAPDGRIRRGAGGRDATSDAQAAALLHAVWFRDRPAFDSVWSWTKTALSRRESEQRDRLFAGRWSNGAVTDWNNATAADQRIAAALLLASRLWNEPHYEAEAVPVLNTLLNRAAISWHGVGGIPAANTFLNDLDPVTTSAATLTPAFYRMFAEASRSDVWLWLLEGTYATLERAMASGGPLGRGAGLLPSWYSVSRRDGRVGDPIDPTWQSTGFGDTSPALAWQLALDMRWHPEHGDERARTLLAPTARFLAGELAQRGSIAGTYSRIGGAARTAETASYGALAGIALPELEPKSEAALRAKLDAALGSRDPDRLLDAIDGLWLLAGGPPNFWRVWWPPEDLPTARNDGVVPPDDERPWQYFGETGHVVQGRFLEYFRQHGGAGTLGLPRTDELVEDGRVVQYFQRARLEYFPEREGTGTEVVPAPLGRRAAAARGVLTREAAKPVVPFESDESRTYVPETGHSLSGGFRTFYERTGGADILGYPLTEELVEDGFTVQYFERAVLEYVPGRPIQGELLGDKLLAEEGWQK